MIHTGFTTFLERKINGRVNGEQALQFRAANGYISLIDSIHQMGEQHNFTALVPDLSGGIDPDDSFSKVPYEKGFYFLYYLQVRTHVTVCLCVTICDLVITCHDSANPIGKNTTTCIVTNQSTAQCPSVTCS